MTGFVDDTISASLTHIAQRKHKFKKKLFITLVFINKIKRDILYFFSNQQVAVFAIL